MSILSEIIGSILGRNAASPPTPPAGSTATAEASGAPSRQQPQPIPGGPQAKVDVEAVLTEKASKKGEKLNWKQSIVDLMKVVDMDSSLAARKKLAQELGYTGALDGSAEMNIWLHKQVMNKLSANGGTIPEGVRH